MIIRSQNKTRLLNMDNVTSIDVTDQCRGDGKERVYSIVCFDVNSTLHHYMGIYTTKDKAMKVIDLLCMAIKGHMVDLNGYGMPEIIFQMPNDDRVQG